LSNITEQLAITTAKKILKDIDYWSKEIVDVSIKITDSPDMMGIRNTTNPIYLVSLNYIGPHDVLETVFVQLDTVTGRSVGPVVYEIGTIYLNYDETTDTYSIKDKK